MSTIKYSRKSHIPLAYGRSVNLSGSKILLSCNPWPSLSLQKSEERSTSIKTRPISMLNLTLYLASGCHFKMPHLKMDVCGAFLEATRDHFIADPRSSIGSLMIRNIMRLITKNQILCQWRWKKEIWLSSLANFFTRAKTISQTNRGTPTLGIWWIAVQSGALTIGCKEVIFPNSFVIPNDFYSPSSEDTFPLVGKSYGLAILLILLNITIIVILIPPKAYVWYNIKIWKQFSYYFCWHLLPWRIPRS